MKISEETLSDIARRGLLTKGEKEQILKNQKIAQAVQSRFDTLTAGEYDGDTDILAEIISELNDILELKIGTS